MTSAMQVHARSCKIAIDELRFNILARKQSIKEMTELPEIGVNTHGLFLQGCDWQNDNAVLAESRKGILFVEMPVLWLKPETHVEYASFLKGLEKPQYQCPLYKTSERRGTLSTTGHSTNFVMYIQLNYLDRDPNHWCRRGVACLCMLDD